MKTKDMTLKQLEQYKSDHVKKHIGEFIKTPWYYTLLNHLNLRIKEKSRNTNTNEQ